MNVTNLLKRMRVEKKSQIMMHAHDAILLTCIDQTYKMHIIMHEL